MGYAFISYSTRNQEQADEMHRLLQNRGIDTWMAPGDIPPGSKYAPAINVAIKECACVVLILSEQAQDSVWVAKEIERAVNYRKPIFPVQLDDVVLNDEFELYISTNQIVMMRTISRQAPELERLFASVEKHTGRQTVSTSDNTQSILQALSDAASTVKQRSAVEKSAPAVEESYEFRDIAFELLRNESVYVEFCNCEVEEGAVQLSFWVQNEMDQRIKLFGENIRVNGKDNSEYTFDYFAGLAAKDSGYCKMELNNIRPVGSITVTGAIEVDDGAAGKLFRTPDFRFVINFDSQEQLASVDSEVEEEQEEQDLPNFEFTDLSLNLIDTDDFHLEFCNCAVDEGTVLMSFWVKNGTFGLMKLFGEGITVNGRANNPKYTFDFFGEVDGNDMGFCNMRINDVAPVGSLVVTGHIEVDNKDHEKVYRTPGFRIEVDFDNMEQSFFLEVEDEYADKIIQNEFTSVPFVLYDDGDICIEVDDFVDLSEYEDEDVNGIGLLMNVKNDTTGLIQLYGHGIKINGNSNGKLGVDYCGDVAAEDDDVCVLIMPDLTPNGRYVICGEFEIHDEDDNAIGKTQAFLIDVDFDQGTILARIYA